MPGRAQTISDSRTDKLLRNLIKTAERAEKSRCCFGDGTTTTSTSTTTTTTTTTTSTTTTTTTTTP